VLAQQLDFLHRESPSHRRLVHLPTVRVTDAMRFSHTVAQFGLEASQLRLLSSH
jgi:hypothetical protein